MIVMARKNIQVDFGYEEKIDFKGTVFFIDSFEDSLEDHLDRLVKLMDQRNFDKIVLYPLHENTLRRMKIDVRKKYYSRLESLEDQVNSMRTYMSISIDKLDGQRKKYTPIDFILNHLTEKHKKPHFVCMTTESANKFASYSSFDEWIRKVNLLIVNDSSELHEKLKKNNKRYEFI